MQTAAGQQRKKGVAQVSSEIAGQLEQGAERRRSARKPARVIAVEAIGPLTVVAGIVWAIAQPYRIVFIYPEGKGLYDYLVQPPLLVVLVGNRVRLRRRARAREPTSKRPSRRPMIAPRPEIAHWLTASVLLFLGLVLLSEAIVGTEVFRRRGWRVVPVPGRARSSAASCSG